MDRILVGTASWTDSSLIESGWYPTGVSSAEDRLGFYASRFPLVEVDSTYYFLPRREVAKRWVERTPAGFTFNVKAFSLLTQHPTRPEALPPALRPDGKRQLYLRHLDDSAVDEIWSRFLSALGPLQKAGKLGAVLFQFPPWFTIKKANKEYLAECAERARRVQACVEFRSPTWLSGEKPGAAPWSMVGVVGRLRAPASRVRFAAFGALDPGFVAAGSSGVRAGGNRCGIRVSARFLLDIRTRVR